MDELKSTIDYQMDDLNVKKNMVRIFKTKKQNKIKPLCIFI